MSSEELPDKSTPPSESEQNWVFKPGGEQSPANPEQSQRSEEAITWTGSEFVARHKETGWYVGLFAVIAALAVGVFFLFKDIITIIAIIVAGLLFAIIAGRDPKQRTFRVDSQGITVDTRLFPYGQFKCFTVLRDGAIGYIDLIPLRRFMPELTLYYAPEDEQRIFDMLASYLPHEERREHRVDSLMKKLKF